MKPQRGLNNDQFQKRYGMNRPSFEFWLGDVSEVELSSEQIAARKARIAVRKAAQTQPTA